MSRARDVVAICVVCRANFMHHNHDPALCEECWNTYRTPNPLKALQAHAERLERQIIHMHEKELEVEKAHRKALNKLKREITNMHRAMDTKNEQIKRLRKEVRNIGGKDALQRLDADGTRGNETDGTAGGTGHGDG